MRKSSRVALSAKIYFRAADICSHSKKTSFADDSDENIDDDLGGKLLLDGESACSPVPSRNNC